MTTKSVAQPNLEAGPWEAAIEPLYSWHPAWAERCARMATNPWRSAVISRKLVELKSVAVNAAWTNLNPEGTRRHIHGALQAGATKDEVLFVLKCASVMSIHTCSLAAPTLIEEAKAAG